MEYESGPVMEVTMGARGNGQPECSSCGVCRIAVWMASSRLELTLLRFFQFLGQERSQKIQFVCSDMWQAYLKAIAKKIIFSGKLAMQYDSHAVLSSIILSFAMFTTVAAVPISAEEKSAGRSEAQPPEPLENSIGMQLVLIPQGQFQMGSPDTETSRHGGTEVKHQVTITQPFYMGVHEVTQADYQKVMANNPSWFALQKLTPELELSPREVEGMKTDRFPVEKVGWESAVQFCEKLSSRPAEQKARRHYRLPTEAEWEYACRAGTTTPFYFGSALKGDLANCNGRSPYGTDDRGVDLMRPQPVGSYPPNAFGLYDMHGNISEWCSDGYEEDPFEMAAAVDPQGPETGTYKVRRGGGWYNSPLECRAAHTSLGGSAGNVIGFRVVCEVRTMP